MEKSMVITISSRDRAGIVKEVSNVILKNGGNLEQSRMARLGGEFAGIMLVSADDACVEKINASLASLEKGTLHFHTRITEPGAVQKFQGFVPHEIQVSGADHEGIVHGIAEYLAKEGANIEELSTEIINAPVSGTPLFSMRTIVSVPPTVSTRLLREKMDELAMDMGLDIEVKLNV